MGQTALILGIKCHNTGALDKYGVRIIGVDVNAINVTENRDLFRKKMCVGTAPAKIARSFLEDKEVAQEFGFPLVIRLNGTHRDVYPTAMRTR